VRAEFDFAGGVVVVTGGASGIGAALARACAAAGADVVVADVDRAGAEALATEDPFGRIEAIGLDVADRDAVEAALGGVLDRHGHVDGLVCAAIVQPIGTATEIDPEAWRRAQAVNLDGVLWCARAVLPSMLARERGSIVVFSSALSELGKAGAGAYASTKGAVVGLARSLARETAGTGVRVNVFRPGVVDTPHYRAGNPGFSGGGLDEPADTVGPLLFLLSEQATMTGSTLTREMPYRSRAAGAVGAGRLTNTEEEIR
jgi:2-hydroxycyclohexanecarboxyl-CoA dehydrogenase